MWMYEEKEAAEHAWRFDKYYLFGKRTRSEGTIGEGALRMKHCYILTLDMQSSSICNSCVGFSSDGLVVPLANQSFRSGHKMPIGAY